MLYVSQFFSGKGPRRNHVATGLVATLAMAGAAIAHTKVNDPTVRAWMQNMMQTAEATKILGQMAKGATDFDPDLANEAARRISDAMALVPALFEVKANDPTSEAQPAIWTDWDRFVDLAETSSRVAGTVEITTQDDLRTALKKIGGTCSACHNEFRE